MAILASFYDLELGQEAKFEDKLSSGNLRIVVEDSLRKGEGKEGFMILTTPSELESIAAATAIKAVKTGEAEFVNLGGCLKVRLGLTFEEMNEIFEGCRRCHL